MESYSRMIHIAKWHHQIVHGNRCVSKVLLVIYGSVLLLFVAKRIYLPEISIEITRFTAKVHENSQ